MYESHLIMYPALKDIPIYDESDARTHSITGKGRSEMSIRECTGWQEVEECLNNPALIPLGSVRVMKGDQKLVVVYFGERT